jgi:outer membrane protein
MYLNFNKLYSFSLLLIVLSFGGIKIGGHCQEECDSLNEEAKTDCLVLTLTNSISQALKANRQLLGTVESLTKAQFGVDLAKSEFDISITPSSRAGYAGGDRGAPGWTIGGGVDVEKKFTTGTVVSLAPSILKTFEHYLTEVQATISQPLLRGLGREYQLSNLRGAQFALRNAYRQLYKAQVQLIIRTIQGLYEITKAEKSLSLNQESFQRIRQFYHAATLKEKIGLADALDVYRAEIELRLAQDSLKGAEERLEEVKDSMRDLLALPLDSCISVEVPIIHTPNPVGMDKAVELALTNRIEIDQAGDEWRENERLARIAKKNLYPELNLVLNYSNVGRAKHFTTSCSRDRENIWGVGFTTSTDFNNLSQQIAVEQSLLAIESASRGIEQTEANIILEVKKAMRQLDRAYERIHLQEEQIKTTEGELYLAKIKFDRGMADNFNVIQAEKSLRSAQQTYWTALIDHVVGEYQLLAAIGLLIDKPNIR